MAVAIELRAQLGDRTGLTVRVPEQFIGIDDDHPVRWCVLAQDRREP